MLSVPMIERMVRLQRYRPLLIRILENGRPLPEADRAALLDHPKMARIALGLALQRMCELSWRPTRFATELAQRLSTMLRLDMAGLAGHRDERAASTRRDPDNADRRGSLDAAIVAEALRTCAGNGRKSFSHSGPAAGAGASCRQSRSSELSHHEIEIIAALFGRQRAQAPALDAPMPASEQRNQPRDHRAIAA